MSPPEAAEAADLGGPVEERSTEEARERVAVIEPGADEEPVETRYVPPEQTTRLQVRMHCAGCSQRIEEGLSAISGVRSVDADHEAVTVIVHHAADVFEGELRDRLREMGYHVDGHPPADAPAEVQR